MPGGRPSKYDAEKHCAEALLSAVEGATWSVIARRCEVAQSTAHEWYDDPGKPEFREAVKKAKAAANDVIKASLFRNAKGQTLTTTTDRVERVLPPKNKAELERVSDYIDEDGLITKQVTETIVTEVKPETTAQIFWLCNRDPEQWRHVQKIEVGGEIDHTVRIVDDC